MHAETLPPCRHVSSRPMSVANASEMLNKYLANSVTHPHLHPDALITPSGVTFSSHGGPTGGVVMHNLRRVAAGLQGEYLEPEPTPEPEEQEGQNASPQKQRKGKGKRYDADTTTDADEDWQNKSDFEREEGMIEVGEVGDRSNFVQECGDVPELETTGGAEVEESGKKRKKGAEGKVDKEARKKAKKAKNKEYKAQKEKARAEKTA